MTAAIECCSSLVVSAEVSRLRRVAVLMSKMPVLATLLVQLRACADAYRTQAIVLNAKLAIIEHERGELRTMREQLAASSARVDHAVDQIARDLTADDNGAR